MEAKLNDIQELTNSLYEQITINNTKIIKK